MWFVRSSWDRSSIESSSFHAPVSEHSPKLAIRRSRVGRRGRQSKKNNGCPTRVHESSRRLAFVFSRRRRLYSKTSKRLKTIFSVRFFFFFCYEYLSEKQKRKTNILRRNFIFKTVLAYTSDDFTVTFFDPTDNNLADPRATTTTTTTHYYYYYYENFITILLYYDVTTYRMVIELSRAVTRSVSVVISPRIRFFSRPSFDDDWKTKS